MSKYYRVIRPIEHTPVKVGDIVEMDREFKNYEMPEYAVIFVHFGKYTIAANPEDIRKLTKEELKLEKLKG